MIQEYELLALPISALIYLIWIIIQRAQSPSRNSRCSQQKQCDGLQRGLIMAGIIFVLFPCIATVLHALSFPLLLGTSWIMAQLRVPNEAASAMRFAIQALVLSLCFIAVHRLCRPLWPGIPLKQDGFEKINDSEK
jgi:hypothetical protein